MSGNYGPLDSAVGAEYVHADGCSSDSSLGHGVSQPLRKHGGAARLASAPGGSHGSCVSGDSALSPRDSFRMHKRRGSGALEDLLAGYLISLSMDHGHDTMIDVTSATSLAQVHTLIQEALNTQHNVVGLSFCELGKEYVCPLSLVLLYPSLFSQRRNPGRTFMPVLEYVGPGADAQPRQHPGVAVSSRGDVQAQMADSQSDGGDSDDSSSGEPASAAVALKEGHGRPLTAPPSDKTQGMARFRPTRREGHGRPLSAIPSDKTHGGRRLRPNRQEGRGRPCSATPSTLRSPGSKSRRSSPDGSGLDTPASAGTGATGGESSPAVPTPTFRRQFAWGAAAVAPGAGAGAGDGDGDGARRGGAGLSTGIHRGEEFDGRAPLAALPAFRGSPEHAQAGATGLDAVDLASDAGALKPDVPLHMHEELLSRARPTSAPAGGRRTRSGVTRTGPGWRQRFGVQQDAWMVVSPGGESTSSVDDPSEPGSPPLHSRPHTATGVSPTRDFSLPSPGSIQVHDSLLSGDASHELEVGLAAKVLGGIDADSVDSESRASRVSSDLEDTSENIMTALANSPHALRPSVDNSGSGGSDSGSDGWGAGVDDLSRAMWQSWRPTGTRHFGVGPL